MGLIASAAEQPPPAPAAPASPRRFRRRSIVLVVVAVALMVGHAPLLRLATGPLVSAAPPAPGFDALWLVAFDGVTADGDRAYETAAELCRQQPHCKILIIQRNAGRLAELGIYPTFEMVSRRELSAAGVPADALEVVAQNASGFWEEARLMGGWLAAHPETRVLLLCEELGSGSRAYIIHQSLPPETAARIAIRGLPNREFALARWWRSRTGLKSVMFAWLNYIYVHWQGEGALPARLNVADYEARAAASVEGVVP